MKPAEELKKRISLILFAVLFSGCAADQLFDQSRGLSGYIAVSTVTTAQTTVPAIPVGPGVIALFSPTGAFVRLIKDYFQSSEYVNGMTYSPAGFLFGAVEGSDRIELFNLTASTSTSFVTNANFASGPMRAMAADSSNNIYLVKGSGNQIEKADSSGTRVGAPFIGTTTTTGGTTCTLNAPWGIAFVASQNLLLVSQFRTSGGTMVQYDTSGNCIRSIATAPYDSNFPTSIAYHSATGKILLARMNDHRIYATNIDGSGSTQIYLNTTRINTPTAMTVDNSGYVYIGSSGTDTVEKFTFDGTTLTPVSTTPLINLSIYAVNPTAVVVIP